MNCTECGAMLRDDALFCHKCGTRIRDMHRETADAGSVSSFDAVTDLGPRDETSGAADDFDRYFSFNDEPEGNGKKKYYLIGLAAAGLLVLLVCFCNSNTFKRLFYKPVDYYRYVEKKNAVKNIGLISGWYKAGGFGTGNSGPIGSEEKLDIRLSDDILTPASEALGMGDLSCLGNISIYGKTTAYDELENRNTTISLSGKQVITLNTIRDFTGKDMYIRIPELGDDYLIFETDALEDLKSLVNNYVPAMPLPKAGQADDKMAVLRHLPDAVKVNGILNRYSDLIFDNIKDVDRSGREILSLGGIDQKCYILTVSPGYRELVNIAGILKETLKEDEDVKDIIVRSAKDRGQDGEEAWAAFTESLELMEVFISKCPETTMKVYVDSRGKIICREISLNDDPGFLLRYGRTINGREFGAQIYLSTGTGAYTEEFNIEGSGKKAGSHYSGDFTLSMTDRDSIGLTLNKFDQKAFEDQKLDAEISVLAGDITDALGVKNTSAEFFGDYLAVLNIFTPESGAYDLSLKLTDSVLEPFSCDFSYKRTGGSRITVPTDVLRVGRLPDLKEYLQKADFERVRDNLEEAGVPKDITKYIDYVERAVDYIDYIDLLL